MEKFNYQEKFEKSIQNTYFSKLSEKNQAFIKKIAFDLLLTYQEIRQLTDFGNDLQMWNEGDIAKYLDSVQNNSFKTKKMLFDELKKHWDAVKGSAKDYTLIENFEHKRDQKIKFKLDTTDHTILGRCPVASPRTLCCNLQTLDAARNCGFDCSYCSIQTFEKGNEVIFEENFDQKLKNLKATFDSNKTYHIGTGQASDSLMWGNKNGILDNLITFCNDNPNVILELKTKSNNIHHLLNVEIPKNMICTWSLNTDTIISNEEHFTVNLEQRLAAARKIADKNRLVGFHFHPIVYYNNWEKDYGEIFTKVLTMFKPEEVALISIGTLTFTKKTLNEIKSREFKTKISQMPLVEAEGKLSYPDEIKNMIFGHTFNSFKAWHGKVFFYLCMEHRRFWESVFKFEYPDNESFEKAMKDSYMQKILRL
ncbi:MAG: hypothetical protein U0T83_11175 [Bacteriovoracaceae bacterium]